MSTRWVGARPVRCRSGPPPRRSRSQRGQAAVELALSLPVIAVLVLALVQFGLVVRDQVLVVHAAREGARAAAVDADPRAAQVAVEGATGLASARLQVSVRGRGGPGSRVEVEVAYRAPTEVPLVGALMGEVPLRARATMRVEGP